LSTSFEAILAGSRTIERGANGAGNDDDDDDDDDDDGGDGNNDDVPKEARLPKEPAASSFLSNF
jgi:hypothetical protein